MTSFSPSQGADLTRLLQQAGLGLLSKEGAWLPAPVSLTPYQLSSELWQQALEAGRLLGLLHLRVAGQTDWLLQQLAPLNAANSLPGQLASLLNAAGTASRIATAVALQRHDLILDQNQQWRWVESNPIAAGMGPLNSQWLTVLQQQLPGPYVDNPATDAQAQLLYEAAATQAGQTKPQIVFVVEPQEDNVFDQQLLAGALQRLGATVQRLTLTQLQVAATPAGSRTLCDAQRQPLHLLYFRTGYNAADYQSTAQLELRAQLEHFDLLVSPSLSQQLAGSKWLQLRLCQYLQQPARHAEFAAQFGFSLTETRQLAALTVPMAAVDELTADEVVTRLAAGWWYKRQAEGGGNVARAAQASHWYAQRQSGAGDILMAPIDAKIRPEPLDKLVQGQWQSASGHISELGIFSLGESASYGGYLLRTKAADSLEGGVHKGFAVLDTVQLTGQLTG